MNYEVTITLLPYCHKYSPKEQFEMTKDQVLSLFDLIEASVMVEVASGKTHYHAIAQFHDHRAIARFRYRLKKLCYLGRTSITQLINEPAYIRYLQKDMTETYALIGEVPLIMDKLVIHEMQTEHELLINQLVDVNTYLFD